MGSAVRPRYPRCGRLASKMKFLCSSPFPAVPRSHGTFAPSPGAGAAGGRPSGRRCGLPGSQSLRRAWAMPLLSAASHCKPEPAPAGRHAGDRRLPLPPPPPHTAASLQLGLPTSRPATLASCRRPVSPPAQPPSSPLLPRPGPASGVQLRLHRRRDGGPGAVARSKRDVDRPAQDGRGGARRLCLLRVWCQQHQVSAVPATPGLGLGPGAPGSTAGWGGACCDVARPPQHGASAAVRRPPPTRRPRRRLSRVRAPAAAPPWCSSPALAPRWRSGAPCCRSCWRRAAACSCLTTQARASAWTRPLRRSASKAWQAQPRRCWRPRASPAQAPSLCCWAGAGRGRPRRRERCGCCAPVHAHAPRRAA